VAVDHDAAGDMALRRAAAVRPVVPVRIAKVLGVRERLDANRALQRYGAEALLAAIEWCDAQARLASGQIGYGAFSREVAHVNAMFQRTVAEGTRDP
jgi:DNA primase